MAATVIALIAVLSLVPVFGVLFVRNEKTFAVKFQGADAGVQMLRNFCYWIAVRMVSRPGLFSLIAVVFVGSLALVYSNLEPRYRLADQVPDKQQAVAASGAQGWAAHHEELSGAEINQARQLGLEIFAWTINAAEDFSRVAGQIDGIITDVPSQFVD